MDEARIIQVYTFLESRSMPSIDLIPVPLYEALQPYHVEYDNIPLRALVTRQQLINSAVDINSDILRGAIGTQGTLSNRLNQSLNEDGSLKASAMDDELHSIGAHTDGIWLDVEYVRMLKEERDKLALISDEATNMTLQFNVLSNVVLFEEGPVIFNDSEGISWTVTEPNIVKANLEFPTTAIHRHYYGVTPQHISVTPDYINYKTGLSTAFAEGSLRVFINGFRIFDDAEVYVPNSVMATSWTLTSFTADSDNSTFALNRALSSDDDIRIDFDIILV